MLFYCDRGRPIGALLVALWTLQRIYVGPIHVVFGPYAPDWFQRMLTEAGSPLRVTSETLINYDFPEWTNGRRGSWCQKPFVIRRSPFDSTLYFDCDHVFVGPQWCDHIWQQIDSVGVGSAHDHASVRRGPWIAKDMHAVTGIQLASYRPVNGGCIGYRRGHPSLGTWIDYLNAFVRQQQSRLLKGLAEEFALGLTLNTGQGGWLDASISRMQFPHSDARGYHLNNGRFIHNSIWQAELRHCFAADFMGIRRDRTELIQTDQRLADFLDDLH